MNTHHAPPIKLSNSPSTTSSISSLPPSSTIPSSNSHPAPSKNNSIPPKSTKSTAPPTSTIRIRDNQRRSRARRKEYILELETKVRGYEQDGVGVNAEIQAAARRVVEMNRHLREEVEMLRGMLGAQASKGNNNHGGVKGADGMDLATPSINASEKNNMAAKGHNGNNNLERRRKSCKSATCGAAKEDVKPPPPLPSPKTSTPETAMESYTMSPLSYDYNTPSYPSPPRSTHQSIYPSRPHPGSNITHQPPPLIPVASPQYQHQQQQQHPPLTSMTPMLYYHHPPLLPQQAQYTSVPSYLTPHSSSVAAAVPALIPPTSSSQSIGNAIDDTSSCLFASHIITSMRSDVSLDQVKDELGCGGEERCDVDNKVLFGVMDRYG